MIKKRLIKFSIFFSLAASIVSCTTISYIPKVSLDVSPRLIHKSALVEKFKDVSPLNDKITPFLGLSVTNNESLVNQLDIEVTNAIVSDFSTNGVFKQVSRRVENPDFIIKGEIKKFYGKSQFNTFAKIALIMETASFILLPVLQQDWIVLGMLPFASWIFGIPITENMAEVEIVLRLYDANDNLINTYTGKAIDLTPASMYENKIFAVPSMTNKTFSKAIMQIRNQILEDIDRLNE